MSTRWEASYTASFKQRLGKSAADLEITDNNPSCPDLWELDNGDIAVIGRDLTDNYCTRLPEDVSIGADEKLVIIPRVMMIAAKKDIPDE